MDEREKIEKCESLITSRSVVLEGEISKYNMVKDECLAAGLGKGPYGKYIDMINSELDFLHMLKKAMS